MAWLLLNKHRRERGRAASSANAKTGVMGIAPRFTHDRRAQIIGGRFARDLWGQFLPAAALQLGLWMYFGGVLHNVRSNDAIRLFLLAPFLVPGR